MWHLLISLQTYKEGVDFRAFACSCLCAAFNVPPFAFVVAFLHVIAFVINSMPLVFHKYEYEYLLYDILRIT